MGIAVVSSLPHMPVSAAPGELASATASTAGKGGMGADFASVLLGLPGMLLERTSPVAALNEDREDPVANGLPDGDAALLTTLGITFVSPDSRGETGAAPPLAKDDELAADSLPTAIVFTDLPPMAHAPTTGGAALAAPTLALSGNEKAAKVAALPAEQKLVATEVVVPGGPASNGEPLVDNQPPRSVVPFALLPHEQVPEDSSDPQQPISRLSPPEHLAPTFAYHAQLRSNGLQEPVHSLAHPLHDPAWSSDFGQKLLWFAGNDRQAAQLTLNPPQLGTIEVSLQLDKNSAQAHFVAASPEVRSAIESAVPRLREMLASAGVELGQVSVGGESFRQQADGGERQAARQPRIGSDKAILGIGSTGGLSGSMTLTRHGSSLVDTFA